jgi:hypothetical protein
MEIKHHDHETVKRVSWAKANVPKYQPLLAKHYRIWHLSKNGKKTLCGQTIERRTRNAERVTDAVCPSECPGCNKRTRTVLTQAMHTAIDNSYDHDGGAGWLKLSIRKETMDKLVKAGIAEYLGQWPHLNAYGLIERTKLRIEANENVTDEELEYLWQDVA